MSNHDTTEYFKKIEAVTMPDDRRAAMRATLSEYADFHAVDAGVTISDEIRSTKHVQQVSVWSGLFTQQRTRTMYLHAALMAALVIGGSGTAAAAAQLSVPGDALYPVKIHVNENIREAFAIGANAEAELQAALLLERLEEAETLAAEGEMEGELAADVEAGIIAQARTTHSAAAAADVETAASVRADLATAISQVRTTTTATTATVMTEATAELDTTVDAVLGILAGTDGSEDEVETATELAGETNLAAQVDAAATREATLRSTITAEAGFTTAMRTEFMDSLDEARVHVTDARASLAANAREAAEASVNAASEILGEIEAALSLMGDIEIDGNTGAIIDIDLNGSGGSTTTGASGDTSGSVDGMVGNDAAVSADSDTSLHESVEGVFGL